MWMEAPLYRSIWQLLANYGPEILKYSRYPRISGTGFQLTIVARPWAIVAILGNGSWDYRVDRGSWWLSSMVLEIATEIVVVEIVAWDPGILGNALLPRILLVGLDVLCISRTHSLG